MSKKITVGLIFGGRSAEHEVSLLSACAVWKNLDQAKFEVRSIYILKDGRWKTVDSPSTDVRSLSAGPAFPFLPWEVTGMTSRFPADVYFPVLHGPYGEDGSIQGLLEMAGVPYVGAGVLGSAVGMDKAMTKSLFRDRGLPIVPWLVIHEADWRGGKAATLRRLRRLLSLPVFVKPSNLGSSVGITKVKDARRMEEALEKAFRYDTKILVEKGIQGREIECSVLGNQSPEASLPGEVVPFREFYDYEDKYIDGKTGFVIPARLSRALTDRIRRLAVKAFEALGVTGMARVDFFIESGTNRIFINELNTIPGFTEISMYPKLWAASGLPFPRLVERLIELGIERHGAKRDCLDRGLG
jgi:D-alanine-D-alanine ligase